VILALTLILSWGISTADISLQTSTSGQWELLYTGKNNRLKDVHVVNTQLGYAVGESNKPFWYGENPRYRGSILRTLDGDALGRRCTPNPLKPWNRVPYVAFT